MRILVVGGGGREHALVWKLAQSSHVEHLYCAPGNAGIARLTECISLKAGDLEGLANFASQQKIDLTIVGPEAPLIAGIVDRFEARGLPIFGPATDPARIEGSKSFAKDLMTRYGIPTASYWSCTTPEEAYSRIRTHFSLRPQSRLVIKANGIAVGKGVVIAEDETSASQAVENMMVKRIFGAAGDQVILEEYLEGEEVSVMAFTDGETVSVMPPSQDHKRAFDYDLGPNTGGMGAYSPVPFVSPSILQETVDTILKPTVTAIRNLGIPYKGVLFAGIMVTENGPKALEFNCRFGDPEAQTILPLLETDMVEIIDRVINCSLDTIEVHWKQEASVCVVAASGGYPGDYSTGKRIEGVEMAEKSAGCLVFHAGTRMEGSHLLTDGGRVLGVTGLGSELAEAADRAYTGLRTIHFEDIQYRSDIAHRALSCPNLTP